MFILVELFYKNVLIIILCEFYSFIDIYIYNIFNAFICIFCFIFLLAFRWKVYKFWNQRTYRKIIIRLFLISFKINFLEFDNKYINNLYFNNSDIFCKVWLRK